MKELKYKNLLKYDKWNVNETESYSEEYWKFH